MQLLDINYHKPAIIEIDFLFFWVLSYMKIFLLHPLDCTVVFVST